MNLILIGYRGTGKTTVAQILAEQLGWRGLDTDEEIERAAGKSIAEIFSGEGEQTFREAESQVLAQLLAGDRQVLALGGGVVLREQNRERLAAANARVVWLKALPETLQLRISADPTTAQRRPELTPQGGITEITGLLAQRSPLYRQCADVAVDTEGKSPSQVAAEILRSIDPASLA